MANSIVERVYWTAFGDPVMKAVFVALADQANGQAFCWPSVDTIIERTEYGERTVRQKLKKLLVQYRKYKEEKKKYDERKALEDEWDMDAIMLIAQMVH